MLIKSRYVLVTIPSIGSVKSDNKNSFGIDSYAYPSLCSNILTSPIFSIQSENLLISSSVDEEEPQVRRIFFVSSKTLQ